MRDYDYDFLETVSIPNDIVSFLVQIHEFKGKQAHLYRQQPDVLSKLVEVAKIQSTGASNRMEGIHTSDQRLQKLKNGHISPINRDEEEILGYRIVLDTIHESHDYIGIKPNVILQLHRDLYRFSPYGFGGIFKNADHIIQETEADRVTRVRFQPVPAFETAASIEALYNTYNEVLSSHTNICGA